MDLDALVADARARYVDAHPLSSRWFDRASAVMPGGNTRSVLHFDPFPVRVMQAEGRYLHDADGHRYVDLFGNYTAGLFGHSNIHLTTAVHKAIDRGVILGAPHEDEVRLAELFVDRFPSSNWSGSRTREPRRISWLWRRPSVTREKDGVVVFDGGYHGGVLTFGCTGGDRERAAPVANGAVQ